MKVKWLCTTLAGLLLIASAAFAVKVKADYDHGTGFGFTWCALTSSCD